MDLEKQLNEKIGRWALLKHPFYQAWESGELPVDALRTYSSEYGAFIRLLSDGWETIGDTATAEEERDHAELWRQFALALGPEVGEVGLRAVGDLVKTSRRLFAHSPTALGALYAFEVQQPSTSKSKLEGLRKYYGLGAGAEDYFETHSNNQHEAAKLLGLISKLDSKEAQQAIVACGEMGEALWNALTDIYHTHCEA